MKASRRIAKMFDLEAIERLTTEATADILANDLMPFDGETAVYMLDIFSEDWEGIHQIDTIFARFGLRTKWVDDHAWGQVVADDRREWAWERIDHIFSDVAEILNRRVSLEHDSLDLWLAFGHSDFSTDWGLLLVYQKG